MYPVVPSNSTRAHWLQLIVISSLSHKYHLISLELSITDHIKRCFLKFFKLIVPPAGEISGFHLCLPTSTLLTAQQLTYIRGVTVLKIPPTNTTSTLHATDQTKSPIAYYTQIHSSSLQSNKFPTSSSLQCKSVYGSPLPSGVLHFSGRRLDLVNSNWMLAPLGTGLPPRFGHF